MRAPRTCPGMWLPAFASAQRSNATPATEALDYYVMTRTRALYHTNASRSVEMLKRCGFAD
eukprot:358578-Chlamydomonas_euryale.AAC.5